MRRRLKIATPTIRQPLKSIFIYDLHLGCRTIACGRSLAHQLLRFQQSASSLLLLARDRLAANCGPELPRPAAPCCAVTASQPTLPKPGFTARFHFFLPRFSSAVRSGIPAPHSPFATSRNRFSSISGVTNPSGIAPRLYSAMRFFHFRKSVMLCGSMRTSTRRRLASSRFIS